MTSVIPSPFEAVSLEMITKLINSGYLRPSQRNDADAITDAIARMKDDLRGAKRSDGGPSAA